MLQLLTIPLSHYCERGRWALDLTELDYEERQVLQPFARSASKKWGGNGTVPVLRSGEELGGDVLAESGNIVSWAAEHGAPLYPSTLDRQQVEAWERELEGQFGIDTRMVAYGWFFRCLGFCMPYNSAAAPAWQHHLLSLTRPLAKPAISKRIGLTEQALRAAQGRVRAVFDRVATSLKDGRPYLCGDEFSAADLAFAALGSISVMPPQYGTPIFELSELPDAEGKQLIEDMRRHPAGEFILRVYEQRPKSRGKLQRASRAVSS